MIDIIKDKKDKNKLILIVGQKSWHINLKEAKHLYKKLKVFKLK